MRKYGIGSCVIIIGLVLAFADSAMAQVAFPDKPIRLIVPYPPGGGTTVVARLVGQKLTEAWGQPVVVDNRPGGNTIIGTDALAKSAPDGYTILMTVSTHLILPHLFALPFDAIREFAPVATLASTEQVLVVGPSVSANNLQELLALAKAKPGSMNYGTAGAGGVAHLAHELLDLKTGVKMQHIPYKGGGQVLTDLAGGQIDMSFLIPVAAAPFVTSGKLKGIAVSGEKRLPAMPNVPTFSEAGLQDFDARIWYGILAPAGTPKAIIDKYSVELAKILRMTDVKQTLVSQGLEPLISTPEQFSELMKADLAKYGKVVKAADIKAE